MSNEDNKIDNKKSLLKKAEETLEKESFVQEDNDVPAAKKKRFGKGMQRRQRAPRRQREPRERKTPFERILTKIIIFLILLVILVGGGYIAILRMRSVPAETKSAMVERQLSMCQEFVTLKYRYSDVVSVKKTLGLSKSYSIVKYNGIIRVGISDITECEYEISFDGKTVKVKLPQTEVLGNEISSQEVFDETHSIFVPISLDEVFTEIQKSRETVQEELIDDGILEEAREYAKRIIKQMLLASGFEEVTFI